jgi:hypothetical protein
MNCFMARRAHRHDSGVPLRGKANVQRSMIERVNVKYAGQFLGLPPRQCMFEPIDKVRRKDTNCQTSVSDN